MPAWCVDMPNVESIAAFASAQPLLFAELSLRAAAWGIAYTSIRFLPAGSYTSLSHGRLLSHLLAASPLLGVTCESHRGMWATLVACSLPCSLMAPGIGAGLRKVGILPPSIELMPARRAAALSLAALAVTLAVGPGVVAQGSLGSAFGALLALRFIWTLIRVGMLMPTQVISRAPEFTRYPSSVDRAVAKLRPGGDLRMAVRGVELTVTRLRRVADSNHGCASYS
jgi:hypothetical protein